MKYLRYIEFSFIGVTRNKVYKIIDEDNKRYKIIDDYQENRWIEKEAFENKENKENKEHK